MAYRGTSKLHCDMAYRLLIFDADGTLYDYDRAERYALSAALRDLDIFFDEERMVPIYRRINGAIWRAFENGEILQSDISTRRFSEFLRELGIAADIQLLSSSYLQHLGEADFLISGAEGIVSELAPRYSMAIVTNGLSRVQRGRFGRSGIIAHFHPIVISDEVGVQKPDPRIFDHVFENYPGIPRHEILMIGDSLTSDIAGGVAAGIDTCWIRPEEPGNRRKETGSRAFLPDPTYEIERLDDLRRLL
jgi:putative hydrolase of the HAD superfamily